MSYSDDDPWRLCTVGSYPDGVRFHENEARFYTSKDSAGNLILFVQEDEAIEVVDILKDIFSGLVLYQDTMTQGTRFVIKLEVKELKDKFTMVCRAIVDDAREYEGANLYSFIYNELVGWSGFMRPKRQGLTHEEYTGLWGELSVVVDHYLGRFNVKDLIDNWTGIRRTPQDLAGRDFTLEVKTTFTVTPKTIHITSLEQLDAPVNNQALVHLRLSKAPDGRSMVDLISAIEHAMKNYPAELARLHRVINEQVGDASEEQMNQKNIILGSDCYHVRDNFPRLCRSNIDVRIDKAEYKLLLHSLSCFKFDDGVEEFFGYV
jgi:hypothetical protein